MIGLAGGTAARLYSAVFAPATIDGVEIDPAVVEAGRRFMSLDVPKLNVIIEDGRYFLTNSASVYDVVIIDAYNPPYIPFHLVTAEFFEQVRDHLTPDGVVGVNVARTETDYALVDAVASTLKSIYPSVYILDTAGDLNSIVVASRQPIDSDTVSARLSNVDQPVLHDFARRAAYRLREFAVPTAQVFTDDLAPVEQITHGVVVRYLLGQSPAR